MKQTSIIANIEASELKEAHQRIIMKDLYKNKFGTSFEISKRTGLDYHAVARRMAELERDERIKVYSSNGLSPTGKRATIWQLEDYNLKKNQFKAC